VLGRPFAVPSSIENPRVMNPSLIRKLEGLIERHEEVQALLGEPGVASDQDRYRALTREYAQLEDIVHAFQRFRQAEENLDTTRLMLEEEDAELREMAQEELPLAKATFEEQEQALQVMLLPRDPKDDNNCYLERASTSTAASSLNPVVTGCSGCRKPNPRAGCTPPPVPSPCCRKCRKPSRSRSTLRS